MTWHRVVVVFAWWCAASVALAAAWAAFRQATKADVEEMENDAQLRVRMQDRKRDNDERRRARIARMTTAQIDAALRNGETL